MGLSGVIFSSSLPTRHYRIDTNPSSKLRQIVTRVFDTDHFRWRFLDFSVSMELAHQRVINVRFGSKPAEIAYRDPRLLSRVKRKSHLQRMGDKAPSTRVKTDKALTGVATRVDNGLFLKDYQHESWANVVPDLPMSGAGGIPAVIDDRC